MHTGRVIKFNKLAGYGVISPLDSTMMSQIYFHHSAVDDPSSLGEGDTVVFTLMYCNRGIQALEIVKV